MMQVSISTYFLYIQLCKSLTLLYKAGKRLMEIQVIWYIL